MVKAHDTRPQRKPKTAGLKESSVPKTRGCGNIGKTRGRSSDFRLHALARRLPIPGRNSDLVPALYPVTAAGPCRSFTGFPACVHGTHLVQKVSIECRLVLSSRRSGRMSGRITRPQGMFSQSLKGKRGTDTMRRTGFGACTDKAPEKPFGRKQDTVFPVSQL